MENVELIEIIKQYDTPLKKNLNFEYTNKFIELVTNLECVKDSKIKELLNFKSKKNDKDTLENIFNQKISEFLVYFVLQKQNIKFDVEQNKNKINNSNVDVSFTYNDIEFNIEIKSPEEIIEKSNTIKVSPAYRFVDKDETQEIIDGIISQINSISPNIAKEGIMTDNKIKDCLLSANNKFDYPNEKTFNVLFLCTSDFYMSRYRGYLMNSKSGFLLKDNNLSYFKGPKNEITRNLQVTDYEKVSIVVLSNGLSINHRCNSKSWDLFNSDNFILINENCSLNNPNALYVFSLIFPHKTNEC